MPFGYTEPGVFEDEQRLVFYDCDRHKNAKLSSLLKYVSELAGRDYTEKGLSHEHLWEEGWVFLVSRMTFKLHRMPVYKEQLRLRTWEHGKQGAQFLRFAEMLDEAGNVLVDAQTAWLLCDPVTRRIVRPSRFTEGQLQRMDLDVAAPEPGKLAFTCTPENLLGERPVRYTDLDANGHVYNAVYADIASDFAPSSLFEGVLKEFHINFVSEAKDGDTLQIHGAQEGNGVLVCGEIEGRRCFETALIVE